MLARLLRLLRLDRAKYWHTYSLGANAESSVRRTQLWRPCNQAGKIAFFYSEGARSGSPELVSSADLREPTVPGAHPGQHK